MDIKEIDNKKEYICLEEFKIGTRKPRTFFKGKKYKFPEDVGKHYVRKGKLKQK